VLAIINNATGRAGHVLTGAILASVCYCRRYSSIPGHVTLASSTINA